MYFPTTVLIVACLHLTAADLTKTYFGPAPAPNLRTLNQAAAAKSASVTRTYAAAESELRGPFVPVDSGVGNFGDLLHLQRQSGDKLIARELLVNPVLGEEQLFYWWGQFNGTVTHVRALNFGRERAYVKQIGTINKEGYTELYFSVAANYSVRLFIEIYGFLA